MCGVVCEVRVWCVCGVSVVHGVCEHACGVCACVSVHVW